ncbi:MAG: peptide deformylase [Thermodesulfovibrionales bacterium]|nr:peptide deformylase [Thermodesulfovibrionales bacterium]
MSILKIYTYPDDVLKERAEEVKDIDGSIKKLIDDMVETMHNASGIGLAANQVGVLKRIFICDISTKEKPFPLIVVINPELVYSDDKVESEEGCLSIPGCRMNIKRAKEVILKGYNQHGKQIEIGADGLLARAIQHEYDHLNGIVLFDKVSSLKREFHKKRYLKRINKGE